MDIIKKVKNVLAVNAILYAVIGIIMILFPGFVNNFICYLIGTLVSVFGISMIMSYFNSGYTALAKGTLILGIAATLFGIYILLKPAFFSSIIPFMAGLLILVESIDKFKHSFELKKQNYDKWYVVFVSGIIIFALALLLILYSFETVKFTIRVIGFILLLDSISDILTIRSYTKTTKKIIIDMK